MFGRALLVAAIVAASASQAVAQSEADNWVYYRYTDPEGSEPEVTNRDPGWWQRTFFGWDKNHDGKFTGEERGVLLQVWDWIVSAGKKIADAVKDLLWSFVPDDWKYDTSWLVPYYKIANAWFPVDYAIFLFTTYHAFLGLAIAVKFTKG